MLVVERNLLRASDEMRSAIARGVMHSRAQGFLSVKVLSRYLWMAKCIANTQHYLLAKI